MDRIFRSLITCPQYLTDAEEQTGGVQPQLREKTLLSWWNFIFLSLKVSKIAISRCAEAGDKVCQLLKSCCCRCAPGSGVCSYQQGSGQPLKSHPTFPRAGPVCATAFCVSFQESSAFPLRSQSRSPGKAPFWAKLRRRVRETRHSKTSAFIISHIRYNR